MSATVLVTGPTGKVGRHLIPLLVRRGITVRTASRSPLPERAGIEPVRFDWTDQSTYETARKGVDAMYLVAGPVPQAEHAGYIRALLDSAAGAAGEPAAPDRAGCRIVRRAVHHPAAARVHAEFLRRAEVG